VKLWQGKNEFNPLRHRVAHKPDHANIMVEPGNVFSRDFMMMKREVCCKYYVNLQEIIAPSPMLFI